MKQLLILMTIIISQMAWALGDNMPLKPVENGGSNYVFYEVGDFKNNWTEESWRNGQLRPVVASYHLNPQKVYDQLATMARYKQKKIALVLWHSPLSNAESHLVFKNHLINSSAGLPEQVKTNLQSIINQLVDLNYEEVQVRIANQWLSNPGKWSGSYESNSTQVLANWYFIEQVKKTVDSVAANKIKVLYDLGVELGGLSNNNVKKYTEEIWRRYTNKYGSEDSMGFSVAVAPNRVLRLLEIYRQVGAYPDILGLDIYGLKKGEIRKKIGQVMTEMATHDRAYMPVIVQETYYNDVDARKEIFQARTDWGFNVRYIMQWPIERAKVAKYGARHITMDYPVKANAYFFNW